MTNFNLPEGHLDDFIPTSEHVIGLMDAESVVNTAKPITEGSELYLFQKEFAPIGALIIQNSDQVKMIQDIVCGGYFQS